MVDLTAPLKYCLIRRMLSLQQALKNPSRWLSGGLAVLVLLLTLASVSPAIHQWLHVDDLCEQHCETSHGDGDESVPSEGEFHICAVTFLSMGATSPIAIELPARTDVILANVSMAGEAIWSGQAPLRVCARAPPIESVV